MALFDRTKIAEEVAGFKPGFYVTDERRLFRVVDAAEGHILLEDVRYPDEQPFWMAQADVVNEKFRLVRPEARK